VARIFVIRGDEEIERWCRFWEIQSISHLRKNFISRHRFVKLVEIRESHYRSPQLVL
jgi:hypothetical protein